ncbi:MAG: glycosyltransferase [Bacteroidales bacterium]|jgi:glycosyltransferase involved in cell wall biosynthesis|nr:glycosyltransferase [Bacteroidales bacterium]
MSIIILTICVLFILLGSAYPFWIKFFNKHDRFIFKDIQKPQEVTLIYLSYNGFQYLQSKIEFLLQELTYFEKYELVIIDDGSTDETYTYLNTLNHPKIKVFIKKTKKGIPHSMNLGVEMANYPNIIFCDQRQKLTSGVLQKIVHPLNDPDVGAVSSKLSAIDKSMRISPLRIFENYIKKQESNIGKLIGVYGPLYAIQKECYHPIPEEIILDDLYLSLQILKSKKIIWIQDASIIDDDAVKLYNYKRIRRYLTGLLQLILKKEILTTLPAKTKWMLFWHKYFKLSIPLALFSGNITIGFFGFQNPIYLFIFIFINLLGAISMLLNRRNAKVNYHSLLCVNIFYIIALFDLIFLFHTLFVKPIKTD